MTKETRLGRIDILRVISVTLTSAASDW